MTNYTSEELNTMTVNGIKSLASQNGYSISGNNKSALISSFLSAQGE